MHTDTPNTPIDPVSDDDLLFFHWQDGLDAARMQQIADGLRRDPVLAARHAALIADLAQLRDHQEPAADALLEARLLKSLTSAQTAVAPTANRRAIRIGVPLAAAVALAIGLTTNWRDPTPQSPDPPQRIATSGPGDRLARQVAFELDTASGNLARLPELDPAARAALIDQWLMQNQALAAAAERAGETRLARTLRAFEPLLRELEAPNAARADDARAQLEFEWLWMHTQLRHRTSKNIPTDI